MEDIFLNAFAHLETNPAFWLCLTLALYVFGQVVFRAAKFNPFASPIIISVAILIIASCRYRHFVRHLFRGSGIHSLSARPGNSRIGGADL